MLWLVVFAKVSLLLNGCMDTAVDILKYFFLIFMLLLSFSDSENSYLCKWGQERRRHDFIKTICMTNGSSQLFVQCCFFEMYPLSSVDYNKECIQIIIIIIYFLSRGSVLSFGILHVQIFIQYIFWGQFKFCENDRKCWRWLATKKKKLAEEEFI